MKKSEIHDRNKKIVLTLRRAIGILGPALPLIVAVGAVTLGNCTGIQRSISMYYNTVMRNVFVGIITATALFMFAYRGYDYRDRIAGVAAFVFALGIAFFPPSKDMIINCNYNIPQLQRADWVRTVHLLSASLYFLTLSVISFFLFTRTDPENVVFTPEKKRRNIIYRICGIVIFISLLLIAIYMYFIYPKNPQFDQYHPIFWLESSALLAFAVSWLIKGEVALKDKEEQA
jgi:hypothetical protein